MKRNISTLSTQVFLPTFVRPFNQSLDPLLSVTTICHSTALDYVRVCSLYTTIGQTFKLCYILLKRVLFNHVKQILPLFFSMTIQYVYNL